MVTAALAPGLLSAELRCFNPCQAAAKPRWKPSSGAVSLGFSRPHGWVQLSGVRECRPPFCTPALPRTKAPLCSLTGRRVHAAPREMPKPRGQSHLPVTPPAGQWMLFFQTYLLGETFWYPLYSLHFSGFAHHAAGVLHTYSRIVEEILCA